MVRCPAAVMLPPSLLPTSNMQFGFDVGSMEGVLNYVSAVQDAWIDIRERCVRFAEQSVKTEKKHLLVN